MRHLTARTAAAALAFAAVVALAGCAPSAKPAATPGATGTGTPAAVTTPTPTPTPTLPPTPVTLTCDQVVTPEQLQAAEPSFAAVQDYAPKAGTLEKQIADWQGATCAWRDASTGAVIEIAVARPPKDRLEGLKNDAITVAHPVPTYGTPPIEGYFKPGKSGQVQIFRGSYWVVAESTAFFEPGDPAPLMQDVLANIPSD
ncbi:MAG: iron ABC transporter ATP-binding protein [Leifsonia sp.]|uniref:iron ABC transporter ATP-binding protein n=1 Tax=Leifsonia sp. TaxID=1870902 RepID=UPI003F7FB5BE